MINSGVLEETISCWNSPALLLKKKDGRHRLITNYKQHVNKVLMVPNWPIVPIRTILSQIGQDIKDLQRNFPQEEIYFHCFDLKSAFYNLAITKSSRDITSFIANERQVRYKRLTMGMNTSPSVFSRFVHTIFASTFNSFFRLFLNVFDR